MSLRTFCSWEARESIQERWDSSRYKHR